MNIWNVTQWVLNTCLWWWVLAGIWPWQYLIRPKVTDVCEWELFFKVDDFLATEGMKNLIMRHPDYDRMKPGDRVLVEVKQKGFRSSDRAGLFVLDSEGRPFTLRLTVQLTRRGARNKLLLSHDMYSPEYVDELVTTKP